RAYFRVPLRTMVHACQLACALARAEGATMRLFVLRLGVISGLFLLLALWAPACSSDDSSTMPGSCTTNAQCGGSHPVCGPAGTCVACLVSSCSGGRPICDGSVGCVECSTNIHCPASDPVCVADH